MKKSAVAALVGVATLAGSVAIASTTAGADPRPARTSAALSASASASGAGGASSGTCTGHWPAETQGQPATFQAGAATGDYLWHNSNGWHLRVTHPGHDKMVFRGVIRSAADIQAVPRHDEHGDVVVDRNAHTVTFRFDNFGYVDGLDFRTACSPRLTFDFTVDGHQAPVDHVFIGRDGDHPLENPFTVLRQH